MLPSFLKSAYPLEKHLFLIPKISLKVLGFYPETKRTWPIQLWALFNVFVHTYGTYAQIHFGINFMKSDIMMALDAIAPAFSSILAWLKIICIWWYRDELKSLIERVRELNLAQKSTAKLRVQEYYFVLATRLSFLVLLGTGFTATSYSSRPIVVNIIRYFNGNAIQADMPYGMVVPEFLLHMPIYPVVLVLCHWYGYVTAIGLAAGDGIFLAFCFYLTTLLKALTFDLDDAVNDLPDNKRNSRVAENETCSTLYKIIDRHNEIAALTAEFSQVIVVLTMGHFVTSSIIIGISVVDLMLFPGYGAVVYVVYTTAVLCEIFLYCLGGTAIMDSSEEFATAAYSSCWYSHGIKVQKMIFLIIVRSQRALTVKVPFFAPSLPVLTSILRFTGSLIALANELI